MSRKPASARTQKSFGSFLQKGTRFLPQAFWPPAFLLLAIIAGMPLIFAVPPGHEPDERDHVLRADSLLHGEWIGHRATVGGAVREGVVADRALAEVITLHARPLVTMPQPISPVQKWLATEVPWNARPSFQEAGSIAGYAPVFYVPGAIAIALCKVLGFSPLTAFLSVRFANFYVFLVAGAAALRIARFGHVLMACTLVLPMTLALAASCSQDGLLIAATCLATACLTRAFAAPVPLRTAAFRSAAVLLACVGVAKPPYAPLTLLLVLPVRLPVRSWVPYFGAACLAALPAAIWSFLEGRDALTTQPGPPFPAGPLWPGSGQAVFGGPNVAGQLHVLAAHPWAIVWLPLTSIAGGAGELLREGVGILDYLCLALPPWLYLAWYAALAASIGAELCGARRPCRPHSCTYGLAASAILLSVLAVGIALYLDWTPVGMKWIGGIEGRYFLPLLPVLVFVLPRLDLPAPRRCLALMPLFAAALDAALLPAIVRAFYPLKNVLF